MYNVKYKIIIKNKKTHEHFIAFIGIVFVFSRKIRQCCENYEADPETEECKPICIKPCENYGTCIEPNRCKCEYGYEGESCEIGKE